MSLQAQRLRDEDAEQYQGKYFCRRNGLYDLQVAVVVEVRSSGTCYLRPVYLQVYLYRDEESLPYELVTPTKDIIPHTKRMRGILTYNSASAKGRRVFISGEQTWYLTDEKAQYTAFMRR